MTRLEKALYTHWVSRFGKGRVGELSQNLDGGRTVAARAGAVVESSKEDELKALVLDGFGGFFHQAVYLRKIDDGKSTAKLLESIELGSSNGSAFLEERASAVNHETRCLLMVTRPMEFLPLQGAPVSVDVPFPVAVWITGNVLTIHVLTMQSTVETWGEIIGQDLRRILTPVRSDPLYEGALHFLVEHKVGTGEYVNFSRRAVALMKSSAVDTFSGTFEVGTAGSTKHDTVRGKGSKPLKDSMPAEYQKLISAKRIVYCEVRLSAEHLGLPADSKLSLYPTVGKIAFRSNLQGRDSDGFVSEMAKG